MADRVEDVVVATAVRRAGLVGVGVRVPVVGIDAAGLRRPDDDRLRERHP